MNKKQLIITLVILLYFPVFAHGGEFASPVGIFNSKLNIAPHGEFATNGLFSKESIFKDAYSEEFKSPTGIFNESSNEFRVSASIFNTPQGEFSSAGLISSAVDSIIGKESFKSPDQGEFKFSLPK